MRGLDIDDFKSLYSRFAEGVLRRCRHMLRDEASAWDAMHETFMRAIRYRTSFKNEAQPRTWLFSIATRVCVDELRSRQRGRSLEQECLLNDEEISDSVEDHLHHQQMVARLLDLFGGSAQQVVVLRYFDGLEVREISQETGLSERTVARRLSDFLERSRRHLEVSAAA